MDIKLNQTQNLILKVESLKNNSTSANCKVLKIFDSNLKSYRDPLENEYPKDNNIFVNVINSVTEILRDNPIFRLQRANVIESNSEVKDGFSKYMTKAGNGFDYLPMVTFIPSFSPSLDFNWRSYSELFPPSNQFFFIQNTVSLFGPFSYKSDNDTLLALKFQEICEQGNEMQGNKIRIDELQNLGFKLDDEFCGENESFIFEYDNNNQQLQFLEVEDKLFLIKIPNNSKNKYYFGDKAELEEFVKKELKGIKKSDFELLDKFLKSKQETIKFRDDNDKKVIKINSYFNTINSTSKFYKEELPKVLGDFLRDTDDGKSLLSNYIREHKDKLPINDVYDVKISDKDNENKKLQEENEYIKNQLEELNNKPISSTSVDLGFDSKEEEKYFFENKEKILETVSDNKLIIKLRVEKGILEGNVQELNEKVSELQNSKEKIKKTMDLFVNNFKSETDIAAAALTFQITSDIISGEYDTKKNKKKDLGKTLILSEFKPETISFEEYKDKVKSNLNELGRSFEDELLSNYLVTLERNFLTVFLGYPGVGKTSLVEKIAKANGLFNADLEKNRFRKIAVEKGWNSTRDLLGFYNSISNKWIDSKTGLLQIIKQLNHEEVSKHKAPPYWILLDEANLSPIENYWANFNSMADDDYAKEITLENEDKLKWNNDKLRFIATVNFDHTTEPLSQRLISRAAIIKLDLPKGILIDKKDFNLPSPLSVKIQFEKESSKSIAPQINKIKEALMESNTGMPIIMSPRKEKAIKEHFKYLEPIINDEAGALDFAILQHLLPIISGQGESFKRRLEELKKALIGLPKSLSEIERIIATGTQYQMFSFFNI